MLKNSHYVVRLNANRVYVVNFKKWFDVPVLEIDLTRMPNLKQALKG